MKLIVCKDAAEASQHAAQHILGAMTYRCDECGLFSLAVGGGSAPPAVYRAMIESGRFSGSLANGVRVLWSDERSVPHDDPESNVRQAMAHLIEPGKVPMEHVLAPNGAAKDLDAEARRYEELLREHLPVSEDGMPVVDLNFLGMGPDGHTASLFPGTKALDDRSGRAFVPNHVPQKNTWRLTMTLPALRASREILVVATGESKAPVLAEVFDPNHSGDKHPIELIHREGMDMLWIVDEAAVSRFTPEQREAHGLPTHPNEG